MCQALALHQSEHTINRLALPLGFSSNNNYTVVIFHNGNGESLRISNLPPLSNIDIVATIPLTSSQNDPGVEIVYTWNTTL